MNITPVGFDKKCIACQSLWVWGVRGRQGGHPLGVFFIMMDQSKVAHAQYTD